MANEFIFDKGTLAYLLDIIWDTFQEKESGKGLSEEDFTAALKSKLQNLPADAAENIIETIKLAGSALTPDANKAVNIPAMTGANSSYNGSAGLVPAPNSADREKFLRGDGSWQTISSPDLSSYAPKASPEFSGTPTAPTASSGTNTTQIATTAFVAAAISAALNSGSAVTFSFPESLPQTGSTGTFYFIADSENGSGTNNYIEYVWNASSSKYEEVGRPEMDLSGYMQSSDYPVITEEEIDDILDAL